MSLSGDGVLIARVTSPSNTDPWAKAALRFRASNDPGAPFVDIAITPQNGVAFEARTSADSPALHGNGFVITAPVWIKLSKSGDNFTGSVSQDGQNYAVLGSFTVGMGPGLLAGLAVTSHQNGLIGTATFDHIQIVSVPLMPSNVSAASTTSQVCLAWTNPSSNQSGYKIYRQDGGTGLFNLIAILPAGISNFNDSAVNQGTFYSYTLIAFNAQGNSAAATVTTTTTTTPVGLPDGWSHSDVGTATTGSATYSIGTFTVVGSGITIYGQADGFQFVDQPLNGDGTIIAHVSGVQNTDPWAKAGIMIRATTAPNAANAFLMLIASNGVAFQSRQTTGAITSQMNNAGITGPVWLKLVRTGNLFSAYVSKDGNKYTLMSTATVPMAQNVFIGLAVTSHRDGLIGTAAFDNVQVTTP